jgi:hypothetical protein
MRGSRAGVMSATQVRALLDQIRCVSHRCDLDLLLFIAGHRRVYLTSERLALHVGHEPAQLARSLDTLVAGGLVTRTKRTPGGARMYALTASGTSAGGVASLVRLAATRAGRLAVIAALAERPESDAPAPSPTAPARGPGSTLAGEETTVRATGTSEPREGGHA